MHSVFSSALCCCTAELRSSRGSLSYFSFSLTWDLTGEKKFKRHLLRFLTTLYLGNGLSYNETDQKSSLSSKYLVYRSQNSSWPLSDQVQFGLIQSNSDFGGPFISKTIGRRAKHFGGVSLRFQVLTTLLLT